MSVIKYLDTTTNTYKTASTTPSSNEMPIGAIIMWYGQTLPLGWLLCNGATVSKTDYPDLFEVIMGSSSTSTTFNLPDLAGTFPFGVNSTYTLGSTGGEETHTLTVSEMPSHTHPWSIKHGGASGTALPYHGSNWSGTWSSSDSTSYPPLVISNTGGNGAHNNMPPYCAVYFIIKALSTETAYENALSTI